MTMFVVMRGRVGAGEKVNKQNILFFDVLIHVLSMLCDYSDIGPSTFNASCIFFCGRLSA
jgi:hypothetical protein